MRQNDPVPTVSGGPIAMCQREFALHRHQHLERGARRTLGATPLVQTRTLAQRTSNSVTGTHALAGQRAVEMQRIARLHVHRIGQFPED